MTGGKLRAASIACSYSPFRRSCSIAAAVAATLIASFPLLDIDWDQVHDEFLPRVSAGMSEAALFGVLSPPQGEPVEILLPLHFPNFDKMRGGNVVVSVADQKKETFSPGGKEDIRYYTGLEMNKDPGVWVVYSGFIIMIAGCFITFFMSHQQFCIKVAPRKNGSSIAVMGIANRNKLGMQRKVEAIAKQLEKA